MKSSNPNGNGPLSVLTGPSSPATVGFRLLDEADKKELAKRSLKAGVTVHELARAYVIDALHSKEEIPELRAAILSLHSQLVEMRRDFAVAVEMLLLTIGEDSKEDIKMWIEKNLQGD